MTPPPRSSRPRRLEQAVRAEIPSGRRVVITGLGVLSPIGAGVGEFLGGILAGRSGAKPITAFDTTGFQHAMGCEIAGFEPERWIHRLDPDTLGRASQFSAAAARMAV